MVSKNRTNISAVMVEVLFILVVLVWNGHSGALARKGEQRSCFISLNLFSIVYLEYYDITKGKGSGLVGNMEIFIGGLNLSEGLLS